MDLEKGYSNVPITDKIKIIKSNCMCATNVPNYFLHLMENYLSERYQSGGSNSRKTTEIASLENIL